MKRTIYLVNLSFGLAGIERRFANIWQGLQDRNNVTPILVIPDALVNQLHDAGLLNRNSPLVWSLPELRIFRTLDKVPLPNFLKLVLTVVRSRFMAILFNKAFKRIAKDKNAVLHIGMNCSALSPSNKPAVYECVDSTLLQLQTRHYQRASRRRCIVHCQTERIRTALEEGFCKRKLLWKTVVSPCYFASYPELTNTTYPRDPNLVAFVGRFSSEKNPLLFVDAIAMVRAVHPEVHALMLGEGPLREVIVAKINANQMDKAFDIGFDNNPAKRLSEAAIYVSLQAGDNYGSQALLEAMGAGCAIIASRVGETERLVTSDVGIAVCLNAEGVAAAVIELLSDPLRTGKMGSRASSNARNYYSRDRYVEFLESLYQESIDEFDNFGISKVDKM